jgi:hypothetical protein
VADVLQKMIIQDSIQNLLKHPLSDTLPCPVLQYVDDTLILLRDSSQAASNLKKILDDFADATGLQINFAKITFVPLNIDLDLSHRIGHILGTSVASFPQTYLGLPLSAYKLPQSAFQPIIDNCNKYLSG